MALPPIPADRFGEFLNEEANRLEFGPMPMGELVEIAHQSITKNFEGSHSPDGERWQPRKNIGDGHPLLIDTTALMTAATGLGPGGIIEVGKREAEVGVAGSVIPYAAIHNQGGGNMPQREYLGMQEEDIQKAEELLADFCMANVFHQ